MSALNLAIALADRLNLRARLSSWRGDCPSCGYHMALSLKVPRTGNRPLLFCANGCTREQLNQEAEQALDTDWTPAIPADTATVEEARAAKAAAALRLWNGSGCVSHSEPASLRHHGLAHVIGAGAFRHQPDCWHPERVRHHSLIGAVTNVHGTMLGVHRTFLAPDGQKADVQPVKASLGPIWGGASRLDPVAAGLVIGEGFETAASAGLMLGLPAWALYKSR